MTRLTNRNPRINIALTEKEWVAVRMLQARAEADDYEIGYTQALHRLIKLGIATLEKKTSKKGAAETMS